MLQLECGTNHIMHQDCDPCDHRQPAPFPRRSVQSRSSYARLVLCTSRKRKRNGDTKTLEKMGMLETISIGRAMWCPVGPWMCLFVRSRLRITLSKLAKPSALPARNPGRTLSKDELLCFANVSHDTTINSGPRLDPKTVCH